MIKRLAALCLCLLAAAAGAQDVAPDALVRSISDEVISIIRQDKDIKAGNRAKINDLVEAKVLPHFGFSRMTALAVGRNWPKANAAQQKLLVAEFRTLLVHTYSGALSTYKNEVIEFKPLRAAAADTDVTVSFTCADSGGSGLAANTVAGATPVSYTHLTLPTILRV